MNPREALKQDGQELQREIDQLIKAVESGGEGAIETLRARLEPLLRTAGDRVRLITNEARLRAKEATIATDRYAHENPWQLIGAAALIGLVAGVFISRRR